MDHGHSWTYLSTIRPSSRASAPDRCEHREPAVCLLPSDDLLCLIRAGLEPECPLIQLRSVDAGLTWQEEGGPGLPGACPQVTVLPCGCVACSFGTRRGVWATASKDQGRSWIEPIGLYRGQTDGYSSLQAIDSRTFRVVYAESSFDAPQPGPNRIVRATVRV